jgi:hypothetical protein
LTRRLGVNNLRGHMIARKLLPLVSGSVLGLVAVGCGGGSAPTSPSGRSPVAAPTPDPGLAAGAAFELISGDTSAAVVGATVTIGTRTYTSDASGRVVLAESVAYGTSMTVLAPDFLDRETRVRRNASLRIVLWPRTTWGRRGVTPEYTQNLVYTESTEGSPLGASPLRRLGPSVTQVTLVLSPEVRLDDHAQESHQLAIPAMNDALGGRVTYRISDARPSTGVVFDVSVNPSDSVCASRVVAYTRVTLQGGNITGGQIVYCRLTGATTSTVLHEIGHTAGLGHSTDGLDVMYRFTQNYSSEAFSLNERLMLWMLFERLGGNRFPDNDRDVSSAARETVTIACR